MKTIVDNNIVEPTNPTFDLSEKDWQDFLSHRLPSEKEKSMMDMGDEDEFFKEAYEGIHSIPNRAQVLAVVNNINSKIRTQVGSPKTQDTLRKFDFNVVRITAIAASLVVVLGVGFLFYYLINKSSSVEMAQNEVDPITAIDNEKPIISSDAAVAIALSDTTQTAIPTNPNEISTSNSIAPAPAIALSNKAKVTSAKTPTQPVTASNSVANGNLSTDQYTEATKKMSEAIALDAKPTAIPPPQAASNEMAKVSNRNVLETAVSSNGAESTDAKWSKAMSLINNGEKKKGKKLLKELASTENMYTKRAKEELKKLSLF
jgi:hypothetical protein